MRTLIRAFLVVALLGALVAPAGAQVSQLAGLEVVPAPVASDGLVAGTSTDFVVFVADPDPGIRGIAMKQGGTVTIRVDAPFEAVADEGVQLAGLLSGWPQSPRVPIPPPLIDHQPDSLTFVGTAGVDYPVDGRESPGFKNVHAASLQHTNPPAGTYPISVRIQPDPDAIAIIEGTGTVTFTEAPTPVINAINFINGAPPPPFPNSIFQTAEPGDELLDYGFYIWGSDRTPLVGATITMDSADEGRILAADGAEVGAVAIAAPAGAIDFELAPGGPAAAVDSFVVSAPAALLRATLRIDPSATGLYEVALSMDGGNTQTMSVRVEHDREFAAYLSDGQEVPAISGGAWGWSLYRLSSGATEFDMSSRLFGVEGVVAAHLHVGARGENGPVVAFLEVVDDTRVIASLNSEDLAGPLEGATIADLAAAIDAGDIYMNVHTDDAPSGAVRGQLVGWG